MNKGRNGSFDGGESTGKKTHGKQSRNKEEEKKSKERDDHRSEGFISRRASQGQATFHDYLNMRP